MPVSFSLSSITRALLFFSKLFPNFFHAFATVGSPMNNFTYASWVWRIVNAFACPNAFLPSIDSGCAIATQSPCTQKRAWNLAFHTNQFPRPTRGITILSIPAVTTAVLFTVSLHKASLAFHNTQPLSHPSIFRIALSGPITCWNRSYMRSALHMIPCHHLLTACPHPEMEQGLNTPSNEKAPQKGLLLYTNSNQNG